MTPLAIDTSAAVPFLVRAHPSCDALVWLAARAHQASLLTRDARALGTYAVLGVLSG